MELLYRMPGVNLRLWEPPKPTWEPGYNFWICFLYLMWWAQSLSRFFFCKTAYLSNNLLAKAWFSFSILSVSLFRTPIFRLVGPFTELFLRDFLLGTGATELHLPLEISTSLLSRILLSLLMVIFFSFVRNSLVFFLSCLFFLSILLISFASVIAFWPVAILPIFL